MEKVYITRSFNKGLIFREYKDQTFVRGFTIEHVHHSSIYPNSPIVDSRLNYVRFLKLLYNS